MSNDNQRTPERRRTTRVPARIEVRFGKRQEAARALRAYSINFSAGGLCLRTQRSYAVGAPLDIAMTIEGEAFELSATVAWVREDVIGVRFEGVTVEDKRRLESIASLLKSKLPPLI